MSDRQILWPSNRLQKLFGIRYPIVQAGMVWVSGWKLCAAVGRCGGLGMIGAGSMKPEQLREHIRDARTALPDGTPFAVNVPLLRGDVQELIQVCLEMNVRIVFTSAGNPATFTETLKKAGTTVVHVVPTAKLAKKCEERGVDAVVCEGTEAGGHNGIDEIPTFVLVPQVRDAVRIPVIAAGGIADGRGIMAALSLGADGVQIGTRFAATQESSAHARYKQAVVDAGETDTVLSLKKIGPTRMIKSPFSLKCVEYEQRCATPDELQLLLDRKRERRGIFEGDWEEGQLEAGMCSGLIGDVPTVEQLMERLLAEYRDAVDRVAGNLE
ncbi:MAG: nitronate monooxygenase [bacterium]|nr:nitronate monooxygenase [bacterium]